MGPFLKGAGALIFLADYFLRASPRSFLLFAASDALLAAITLYALMASPASALVSRGGCPPEPSRNDA